jgi:hypothetical protein
MQMGTTFEDNNLNESFRYVALAHRLDSNVRVIIRSVRICIVVRSVRMCICCLGGECRILLLSTLLRLVLRLTPVDFVRILHTR